MKQKARYNRISSPNQKLERQIQRNSPDEIIFNDIVSGAIAFKHREKGKELIKAIEDGKVNFVTVTAVDRLGRNLSDLINTLEYFTQMGVTLRVDNLGIESMVGGKSSQVFKLILSVLGNVSEMERDNLRERQLEGIAIAKANGVYKGRVRGSSMPREEFLQKYSQVVKEIRANENLPVRKLAKISGVGVGTVQRVKSALAS
jgi:DNA invertase Pin-like site-specific DNA recombinase